MVTSYNRDIMLDVYFRYRDEKDRERLRFTEIKESFRGPEYRYVTGMVSLAHLYELRHELKEMDGFLVGQSVSPTI